MNLSGIGIGFCVVGLIVGSAQGGEKCCGAKKTAALAAASAATVDVEETYLTLASSLPTVQYRIGSETTCCSMTANKAKEAGKTISFVVGKEEFKTEPEADARVKELTAARLEELRSVRYSVAGMETDCIASAMKIAKEQDAQVGFVVGGIRFDTMEQAQKAAERVKTAGDDLKVSYKVGEKKFCCDKMAGAERDKSKERMVYVVGESETCCEREAEHLLAKARVQAIVIAAASS